MYVTLTINLGNNCKSWYDSIFTKVYDNCNVLHSIDALLWIMCLGKFCVFVIFKYNLVIVLRGIDNWNGDM